MPIEAKGTQGIGGRSTFRVPPLHVALSGDPVPTVGSELLPSFFDRVRSFATTTEWLCSFILRLINWLASQRVIVSPGAKAYIHKMALEEFDRNTLLIIVLMLQTNDVYTFAFFKSRHLSDLAFCGMIKAIFQIWALIASLVPNDLDSVLTNGRNTIRRIGMMW